MVMRYSSFSYMADFSTVFARVNKSDGLHFIQKLNSYHKSEFYSIISI